MERLIPAYKLNQWAQNSTSPEQRKARRRWIVAYCYGASFRAMMHMAAMPVDSDHITDPPERNLP